jgi:NTE family protein
MRSNFIPQSLKISAAIVVFLMLASCTAARYALNPKLDMKTREHPLESKLMTQAKSDDLFLILSFSGGGIRAASLSYGVLEALDQIEIPTPQNTSESQAAPVRHSLLDEVDLITGVSGGSITAAYYGLHGREALKDFRENVLLKNLQVGLIRTVINPVNWVRLWSPHFGRSDIAQEYYDSMIFHGATLGDLASGKGPAVNILATDANDGIIFPFLPSQFSLICSDFEKFPLSRAVAASAAFPGALSPIVLKNYAGECSYKQPDWMTGALAKPDPTNRVYYKALMTKTYLDPKTKPYIHLIDGGVSDNLGVRSIMESIAAMGGIRAIMKKENVSGGHKLVFIIVDAQTQERKKWSLIGEIPGIGAILDASSTIMINKYNFETIDLLRRYSEEWTNELKKAGKKDIEIYIVHICFDSLPDKDEREYFQEIPTALSLPEEQVDKLRAAAGKLLYAQEPFVKLVKSLSGSIPEAAQRK